MFGHRIPCKVPHKWGIPLPPPSQSNDEKRSQKLAVRHGVNINTTRKAAEEANKILKEEDSC